MAVVQLTRKAVSVAEAAEMIGISTGRAYQLVHSGELPAKHIGKRWLVPVAALERWLEEPDVIPLEEKAARWG